MTHIKHSIFALVTTLALGACATKTVELESAAVFEKHQAISELKQMLSIAQKSGTEYLAPDGFGQAKETYNEAFDLATAQQDGANQMAKNGITHLQAAMKIAETSKVVLRDVLDARTKAMKADAQGVFPDKFSKLESRLKDTSMDIEKGEIDDAKEQRASLIEDYSKLELSALKTSTTQQAKTKIAEAEKSKADKYSSKTFKLAQEELALALDVLSAGRTQTKKAQEHASKSVYYSDKSMQITDLVVEFKRRDFSEEDMLLWYQDQLELINKPFNKSLPMDRPNYDVVTDVQNRITGIQSEVKNLSTSIAQRDQELTSASENIAMLEGQVESIDAKHKQDKDSQRKAEARFKTIQNMFSEEEAYVFRQGNNVLLETHAFNFKIGGSEIDSGNYGLLEKIMDAIKVFNNPDILIMGHTDSTGGDAINLHLSQKRAQTVTAFLKKIGKLAPSKASTKGFGESRPVASNETKEGRERNRRIEVLIINK